jgi:uncharacterized protein YndB with AHSA1/START domain
MSAMAWDSELRFTRTFAITQAALWEFWSSEEGLARFFGVERKVEFRPDGAFEIYFLMDNPQGMRGSEGCRILRMEPPLRLAFTWNAPPHLPNCRNQRTVVEVRLEALENGTRLTLVHQGFGIGEEWDACRKYFEKAWPVVLDRLSGAV